MAPNAVSHSISLGCGDKPEFFDASEWLFLHDASKKPGDWGKTARGQSWAQAQRVPREEIGEWRRVFRRAGSSPGRGGTGRLSDGRRRAWKGRSWRHGWVPGPEGTPLRRVFGLVPPEQALDRRPRPGAGRNCGVEAIQLWTDFCGWSEVSPLLAGGALGPASPPAAPQTVRLQVFTWVVPVMVEEGYAMHLGRIGGN